MDFLARFSALGYVAFAITFLAAFQLERISPDTIGHVRLAVMIIALCYGLAYFNLPETNLSGVGLPWTFTLAIVLLFQWFWLRFFDHTEALEQSGIGLLQGSTMLCMMFVSGFMHRYRARRGLL